IQGETGTGKGVLAAWLHYEGPRAAQAFADLPCAGISSDLLEAGLFGSSRAEPPGSGQALLDVAHLGTLFLDELGDLDPRVQERLLQALTAGRYRPPGSTRDREVNVHLIAATRRDLG